MRSEYEANEALAATTRFWIVRQHGKHGPAACKVRAVDIHEARQKAALYGFRNPWAIVLVTP